MCTAVNYKTKDHYFGRSLDYEYSYHETVTITPRNYPFHFRKAGKMDNHYAMIGMAFVVEDYPLYYDAVNEKGLAMAGLNFPGNADYKEEEEGKDGAHYRPRCGLALETQVFPDAPNKPQFPSSVFGPDRHYHTETVYRFV